MTDLDKRSEAEILKAKNDALAILAAIKSEESKRAEKSKKAFDANIDKIKRLILESGVTKSIRFDIEKGEVLHKFLTPRSSNGSGTARKASSGNSKHSAHLTLVQHDILASKLSAKNRPVKNPEKTAWFKFEGIDISATGLAEYGITLVGNSGVAVNKEFPELTLAQCGSTCQKWMGAGYKEIVEANLSK